jgi:uncharacterized membrane protein YidH (DUF202 family)
MGQAASYLGAARRQKVEHAVNMNRVGQNRIYTPYMTVYLVIALLKLPYTNRIYMVLANPKYETSLEGWIWLVVGLNALWPTMGQAASYLGAARRQQVEHAVNMKHLWRVGYGWW